MSVVNNEETGQTVTVDMGNGYQAVYGQLKRRTIQAEEYVPPEVYWDISVNLQNITQRKGQICTLLYQRMEFL